eukprot:6618623-Pyramimonas_sp.AAC.1
MEEPPVEVRVTGTLTAALEADSVTGCEKLHKIGTHDEIFVVIIYALLPTLRIRVTYQIVCCSADCHYRLYRSGEPQDRAPTKRDYADS